MKTLKTLQKKELLAQIERAVAANLTYKNHDESNVEAKT
jgi:hypothetical protein